MRKIISNVLLVLAIFLMAVSAFGFTISWKPNDPSEQVTNYRVYWSQGQNPFQMLADTGTNTSYTITNIAPGVYRFYVTARNFWSLESDPSDTVATPPPASSPKVPMLYVIVGTKTNVIVNIQ